MPHDPDYLADIWLPAGEEEAPRKATAARGPRPAAVVLAMIFGSAAVAGLVFAASAAYGSTVTSAWEPAEPFDVSLDGSGIDGGGYDDPFPVGKGARAPVFFLPAPCARQLTPGELDDEVLGTWPTVAEWDRYVSLYAEVCRAETRGAWVPVAAVTAAPAPDAAGFWGSYLTPPLFVGGATGTGSHSGGWVWGGGGAGGGGGYPGLPGLPGLPGAPGTPCALCCPPEQTPGMPGAPTTPVPPVTPAPVPLPASILLLGAAVLGLFQRRFTTVLDVFRSCSR